MSAPKAARGVRAIYTPEHGQGPHRSYDVASTADLPTLTPRGECLTIVDLSKRRPIYLWDHRSGVTLDVTNGHN